MIATDMAARSYLMSPLAIGTRPWTVIYDADCGFCRMLLALLLQLDRHRRLDARLALQTKTAATGSSPTSRRRSAPRPGI